MMTKTHAFKKTLKAWESRTRKPTKPDYPECGFCNFAGVENGNELSKCPGACPLMLATGRRCRDFKWFTDYADRFTRWVPDEGLARTKARHIVACLKRLGKREGWDK